MSNDFEKIGEVYMDQDEDGTTVSIAACNDNPSSLRSKLARMASDVGLKIEPKWVTTHDAHDPSKFPHGKWVVRVEKEHCPKVADFVRKVEEVAQQAPSR